MTFSDEEKQYLEEPRLARIATCGPNGPHVVPMWFARDGDSIVVTTNAHSKKVKNLRRNPEASITIDGTEGGYGNHGVIVKGEAEVAEDEGYEETKRVFRRYLDSLDDSYTQKVLESDRVTIRITPGKVLSWGLE